MHVSFPLTYVDEGEYGSCAAKGDKSLIYLALKPVKMVYSYETKDNDPPVRCFVSLGESVFFSLLSVGVLRSHACKV